MRTTVTLDQNVLEKLLETTGASSQSQAIRMAVEAFVHRQKIAALDRYRGKVSIDRRLVRWRHASR